MEFTDYYAVLGVPRDADAAAVKAAYRKLARTLHPDVNKDPKAEERFKKVNEAYEVLKDKGKRAKYDRLGANWEEIERQEEFARQHGGFRRAAPAGAPGGFSDFFETFFADGGLDLDDLLRQAASQGGTATFHFSDGGFTGAAPFASARAPRRGHDIEDEVEIDLEEAARGGVRLFRIGDRQVEVRIPAGVADGSRVRVAGEGGAGRGGGARGDVYLRVRLRPHLRFTVRGRDLLADLPVRDDQAVLGATIPVAGLLGSFSVTVPAGSQGGRVLRLRGKGLPGVRGAGAGDLLLTLRITVPPAPTDEERDAYRRLARLRGAEVPIAAETTIP